jgi:hypothetical protein
MAAPPIAANNVIWTTLGPNENGSMPIGNGDLAANVWTEANGDLVLLVAKSDSWTSLGKLVKLGRVRVHLVPNPFTGAQGAGGFTQTLRLEDGSIVVQQGANRITVWADANHPALHVEAALAQPARMTASLELWRTNHPYAGPSPDKGGLFEFGSHAVPIAFQADTVVPATGTEVVWYHDNQASIYPLVLNQEHLGSQLEKNPDPLLHRTFGGALLGPGLVNQGDRVLVSRKPQRTLRLDLITLTQAPAASPAAWRSSLASLVRQVESVNIAAARSASARWWQQFWNRSWIQVTGSADAQHVAQGYAMQRYMMAASSRGAYPVKFNGGLFTVGHDMSANADSTRSNHDPDFRQWGNSYWNQNNRLLYWPLLATGDWDLIQPWFNLYVNALPLAKARTEIYDHHAGAAFIETMTFWGLPNLNDFGWDNPSEQVQSRYMRYHTQGALEVIDQMLDEYAVTQDAAFARKDLVPLASAIVTYYDLQWPRDAEGKIHMAPVQSIETYQLTAVNPTPDIAGLQAILPRLLALPAGLSTNADRATWARVLRDLPPIATGRTAHGKIPPLGVGDPDGTTVILPAAAYPKTSNVENPEDYVDFPYELYGAGKPGLQLARDTFAARLFPQDTCWGQDGPQAAVLGLTATAEKAAIAEFTNYGQQRFGWFWKSGHDWTPDLDNGGTGMMTLELMLMQTDGKTIRLLPAWPADWTADFKLHAPGNTTVAGHVQAGRITDLQVTPGSRRKDVVVISGAPPQL